MARSLAALALAASCALAVSLAAPAPATASPIPSPFNWTVPRLVPVVGVSATGVPDPLGEVLVVARDLTNLPMENVLVVLDFGECTDLRLCVDPHDPAATVNCAAHTVSKRTDIAGRVTFRIVGGSAGTAGSPAACAVLWGNGVRVATADVAIYDLDGMNGVLPADFGTWLTEYFGGSAPRRDDYDGNGTVGPSDLSLWLDLFFASGSIENCSFAQACAP